MEWFRWYHGTTEDGKFRLVARNAGVTVGNALAVWVALLEDAAHRNHRGVATRGEDYYAAVLEIGPAEVEEILAAMQSVGMVSVGPGAITICNWKERQFETDLRDPTNAERQRRFRDKHRANGSGTEHNGTVTATKRPDTDTESETDTEKRKKAPKPPFVIDDAFREWAKGKAPLVESIDAELEAYRDWQKNNGAPKDEAAGFRNWLRKANQFAAERAAKEMMARARAGDRVATVERMATALSPDESWRNTMRFYRKTGKWIRNVDGPPPGDPNCRVPQHILDEFKDAA